MELKTEIYLNIAKESARLSKDKNTHVGCVIVDVEGKVVSTGRNGSVAKVNDKLIPYSREEEALHYYENGHICEFKSNKYPFMLHSEINSILMTDDKKRLIDSTLYVTGMPCPTCALVIAQSKIGKVVMPKDWDNIAMIKEDQIHITKYIFAVSNVELYIEDERVPIAMNKKYSLDDIHLRIDDINR